jgi:hypothetical protein
MSRTLCIAILTGVAVSACSKGAAQGRKDTTPAAAPAAQITVVGCVQPSDKTATNAAGTNDTKYMLTRPKGAKKDDNKSTAGTTGNNAAADASTYRLDASDATLASEVGHQVEIVAVVEDVPPAAVGTGSGSGRTAAAPKLRVEEIKMVAVPCPD